MEGVRWFELVTKQRAGSRLSLRRLWRQRVSGQGRPAPGAEGISVAGHPTHLEQHPAAPPARGNKVGRSALEELKMQMYRNFRPSPSLPPPRQAA